MQRDPFSEGVGLTGHGTFFSSSGGPQLLRRERDAGDVLCEAVSGFCVQCWKGQCFLRESGYALAWQRILLLADTRGSLGKL